MNIKNESCVLFTTRLSKYVNVDLVWAGFTNCHFVSQVENILNLSSQLIVLSLNDCQHSTPCIVCSQGANTVMITNIPSHARIEKQKTNYQQFNTFFFSIESSTSSIFSLIQRFTFINFFVCDLIFFYISIVVIA